MKILHVTPVYLPATEWGGPVRSVAALARGQHELGHEVTVLTTDSRGAADLVPHPAGRFTSGGETVIYHHARFSRRYAYSAGLARDAGGLARDADMVHIHGLWTWPSDAGARACRSAGAAYVLAPRGMLLNWALSQKSLKKRVYRFLIQNRNLMSAAALHCTSEQERGEIPRSYRHIPAVVIPNPIEMDDLLQVGEGEFGNGPYRMLICGRIHAVKGFDHLIPALAAARRQGLDARLTVAGADEGGYGDEVRRMAEDHRVAEWVDFPGRLEREELVTAYRQSAVLVMPSYQENFGMAAAEAMAAARPVIVTPGVNIADDIREAGAGLVVAQDPEAIAGALRELASDPDRSRTMGRNGRKLATERYAGRAVAGSMVDAYRRILEG